MATYTSGTSATTYQPYITGGGQQTTNFDPFNDFGYGPTSPNGNVYFWITNISGKAKGYDASSTVTMFVGGTSTSAYSVGTSTSSGTAVTTSAYSTTGGSINTVVKENTTFYAGYATASAGGLYTTRSTGDSGYNVYASGSVSFSNSQAYFVLTYYPMPDTSGTPSVYANGQNSIYVSIPGTPDATGYRVQYSTDLSSWTDASITNSGYINSLSANTTYYVRHAAFNGAYGINTAYTGPWSGSGSATTDAAVSWSGAFDGGRVGVSYADSMTASGSGGSISFSGSVPPGTSNYVSGESYYVSGTPTGSGNYTFTLTASGISSGSQTINVAAPFAPSFNSTTFSTGKEGSSYGTSSITANNTSGAQNITTSVSSIGGLSISTNTNTVTLSGTPTSAGNLSFTATAYGFTDNGTPNNVTTTLYISITAKTPPTWSDSTLLNTFVVGTAYSDGVSATNSPTYSVYSGTLPTGISLNTSTGAVTGNPTTKQVYSFTLRATNLDGFVEVSYSGTTSAPPIWQDETLAEFYQGRIYSDSVAASQTPTYTVTAGAMPVGITFSNGNLSGTPTGTGAWTFTIRATNADGFIQKTFSGTIKLPPNWIDDQLGSFVENVEYFDSVTATNTPTYAVSVGSLPTGVSLNTSTGALTGTPTVLNQAYSFTIRAYNVDGEVTKAFSGTVVLDNGGGIKVYDGTTWNNQLVYAYDASTWKEGKLYVFNGNIWVKSLF